MIISYTRGVWKGQSVVSLLEMFLDRNTIVILTANTTAAAFIRSYRYERSNFNNRPSSP